MTRVFRAALPVVIVLMGVGALYLFTATRPEPERAEREEAGALVEIVRAEIRDHEIEVEAGGAVEPARRVALAPETTGRVAWVSEDFVPGGRFREGELILRLDDREHRLAARQREAEVDSARTELELERGRADVAEREWRLFEEEDALEEGALEEGALEEGALEEDGDSALARREPQLRTAEAAVEAAESARAQAELGVARTRLRAPFDAIVLEKSTDVGDQATAGQPVATLAGTEEFWVRASIPSDQLRWLDVPGTGGTARGEGAAARVVQATGSEAAVREGRVRALVGDVDQAGRMARLIVAVRDPFGLEADERPDVPLLVGSYAEVFIEARAIEGAAEIPRRALRDGDRVYLMDERDRLEAREVGVAWRGRERVLIDRGLETGDRVVVTPLAAPAEGLRLRATGEPGDVASGTATPDREGGAAGGGGEGDGGEGGE